MIYHILLAFVVTFIITVVLGKIAIPMLRSLHAQQSIREEGPESHQRSPINNGPMLKTITCLYLHSMVRK